jgi:hypothetical protein
MPLFVYPGWYQCEHIPNNASFLFINLIVSRIHQPNKNFSMHAKPTTEQESKLPDQIADAWAAVLIDIYQRLKQREEAKPKQDETK